MKLLEFFRDNWRVLKIPVLTLSSACALVAVATTPIMAQDSSSVGDSIQTPAILIMEILLGSGSGY